MSIAERRWSLLACAWIWVVDRLDAVVCPVPSEGPLLGSTARRLCEFGGPDVAELAAVFPGMSPGTVEAVGGGRLPASHVLFTAQHGEFEGLEPLRPLVGEVGFMPGSAFEVVLLRR